MSGTGKRGRPRKEAQKVSEGKRPVGRPKIDRNQLLTAPRIDAPDLVKLCQQYEAVVRKRKQREGKCPSSAEQKWRRLSVEERKRIRQARRNAWKVSFLVRTSNRSMFTSVMESAITGQPPMLQAKLLLIKRLSKQASDTTDELLEKIISATVENRSKQ